MSFTNEVAGTEFLVHKRKTRFQFSCIPQVAPRHRGNDCQIRWGVSVGSLFINTVASVSSSSDSKTLLLLPCLPLLPWLPKIPKTFVNKQLEPHNHSWLHAAACRKSWAEGEPHTRRSARKCDIRCASVSTGASTGGSSHSTSGSHVILRDVRGDIALMIVHILLFGLGKHGHRLWHLLLPPPLPPAHSRRAAQLHAIDMLHRAMGLTPHHSFAGASKRTRIFCRAPVRALLSR